VIYFKILLKNAYLIKKQNDFLFSLLLKSNSRSHEIDDLLIRNTRMDYHNLKAGLHDVRHQLN